MSVKFANFARTTLTGAVDQLDTVIQVVDASVFPPLDGAPTVLPYATIAPYFYAALQHPLNRSVELVKVVGIDQGANQLTVERGAEGTSPLAFPVDSMCEQRITAATLTDAFIESTGDQILTGSLIVANPYVFGGMDSTGAIFSVLQVDPDDEIVAGDYGRRFAIAAVNGEAWVIEEADNPAKQYRLFHENFTPSWDQVEGEDYLVQNGAEETKTARERFRIGSSDTSALLPAADAVGVGAWSSIGLSNAWFAHGWFTQLHSDMTSINQAPTQPEHGVNKAYLESDVARWKQYARGEAELNSIREANKNQFAASGDVHFGKHHANQAYGAVNEGLWTNGTFTDLGSNVVRTGRNVDSAGESETYFPVKHVAGLVSQVLGLGLANFEAGNVIKLDVAPDGRDTFNVTTGERIRHADVATAFAAAAADPDVEVVTDRHDMFGGEFFLEAVTQANPFAYDKGMIQTQSPTMNGIATTRSNRPVTYYAVFDGDDSSAGLGVDFWAATAEEKIAMLSDASNNLFIIKDEFGVDMLVQWRMRQRTVNGAGNGGWFSVNPSGHFGGLRWGETFDLRAAYAQGQLDAPINTQGFDATISDNNTKPEVGVFTAYANEYGEVAVKDRECYFQVWGVVPRLSQAAFVKGISENGAGTGADGLPWYESASDLSTLENAFLNAANGDIASGISGRDDGKFFDGIYASGQGGVNDERVTAWDMGSKEEASKIFQKVVNGTYRGEEKLTLTTVRNQLHPESDLTSNNITFWFDVPHNLKVGDIIHSAPDANPEYYGDYFSRVVSITDDVTIVAAAGYGSLNGLHGRGTKAVCIETTDSSVSGEFTMYDVIGDPNDILAVPELADGWIGGWIGMSLGSGGFNNLSRKALREYSEVMQVRQASGNWTAYTRPIDTTLNRVTSVGTGEVGIKTYTAFAKQTVEANNDRLLNSDEGLGKVFTTKSGRYVDRGVLLAESLMGKVVTDAGYDSSSVVSDTLNVVSAYIQPPTGLLGTTILPTHSPVTLAAPSNDSPAVKALWYQTANNQQVSLNFAWNELVWNTVAPTPKDSTVSFTIRSVLTLYKV